jgi:hypothetical protein
MSHLIHPYLKSHLFLMIRLSLPNLKILMNLMFHLTHLILMFH